MRNHVDLKCVRRRITPVSMRLRSDVCACLMLEVTPQIKESHPYDCNTTALQQKSILSCRCSGSALVRTVANYGILARSSSFIGRNFMFLCNRFHFSAADFRFCQASHLSNIISRHHLETVSDKDLYDVNFAAELLCLRDQSYTLTNDVVLNKDDLNDLLSVVLCE